MRSIALTASLLLALLLPSSALASAVWSWPVEGQVITPYRNGADPYAGGQHRGIDIAAPEGATVGAVSAGSVTFAGVAGSSGLTVNVRTDDGFDTSYLHLSAIAVRAGERVAAGAPLGRVGTSGRRSAAEPHLHFGVREAGSRFAYRDPLDFLPPPAAAPAPRAMPAPAPAPVAYPVRPDAQPLAPVPAVGSMPLPGSAGELPLAAGRAAIGAPASAARGAAPSVSARPVGSLPSVAGSRLTGLGSLPAAARPGTHAPRHGSSGASPTRAARERAAAPAHRPRHSSARQPAARRGRAGSPALAASGPPRPTAGPSGRSRVRDLGWPAPTRAAARRSPPSDHHHGLDLGWLTACAALVTAAGLLGRPRRTGRSVRRAFGPRQPASSIAPCPTTSPRRSTT